MIKNTDSKEKQTVCIVDAQGREIGRTYPKRAAGLVKKGRACYMDDLMICLNTSDTEDNSEVISMEIMTDNITDKHKGCVRLDFNPRTWNFNPKCRNNVGCRSMMEGPDGELAEAYMIGNWQSDWTEILSRAMRLEKNTNYVIAFWLNGGENDRCNEICRFEVIFDYDEDNRYTYNLNRNFIKPVRRLNHWELYEIPFCTGNNELTELKFVAMAAYMTVMGAKENAAYEGIEDHPDLYERWRPQRHNIIFADGFPNNTQHGAHYSTEFLRREHGAEVGDPIVSDRMASSMPSIPSVPPVPPIPSIPSVPPVPPIPQDVQNGSVSGSCDLQELREQLEILQDSVEALLSMENVPEDVQNAIDDIQDAVDDISDMLEE